MPRNLSSSVITALESTLIRPAFLVSCGFLSQTIYVWSGVGTLSWNSKSWLGIGTFGAISAVSETTTVEAQGITLSLSGIPTELLGDSLNEMTTAGKAQIYLTFMDSSGALILDPVPAYSGQMDQPTIDLSAETATITIAVENRLSDLNRGRGGRYTDQDQRRRHPSDGSLQFVTLIQDAYINWHS